VRVCARRHVYVCVCKRVRVSMRVCVCIYMRVRVNARTSARNAAGPKSAKTSQRSSREVVEMRAAQHLLSAVVAICAWCASRPRSMPTSACASLVTPNSTLAMSVSSACVPSTSVL